MRPVLISMLCIACCLRAAVAQEVSKPLKNITNINKSGMNNQSFTTTILVDKTPKAVFNAVNNVRGWWSEQIEGNTDQLNAEFTYHYKDLHRSKMKIIEMVPDKKVVWLVTDNHFNFTKDKTEWKGTKVIFEIAEKEGKTQLRFTHLGLVPEYECYEVCFDAWSKYINHSLRDLIETGKGQPNPKGGTNAINAQVIEKHKLKQ